MTESRTQRDKAITDAGHPALRREDRKQFLPLVEKLLKENPEWLADPETCQLTKEGYMELRWSLANAAEKVFGRPFTTGAVKHWLSKDWGYWYTPSQRAFAKK